MEGSESLGAISVSLLNCFTFGIGGNIVMTHCSESGGGLRKPTMQISTAFFGRM
jgi:hypothetical protein